jgi:UDP-2,4-diacetamido-2,4,6-trideoxy-beta-L-altropyranose hydrolase
MAARRAVVLADAATTTGLGHYVRSSALAGELQGRGWAISYLHRHDAVEWAMEDSRRRGWDVSVSDWNPDDVRRLAASSGSVLVVDSYRVPSTWFGRLVDVSAPVVAIDDVGDRALPVDLVVNQNVGADELSYSRTRRDTRLLLGPDYALLRPQFRAGREAVSVRCREVPETPHRVLVILGGTDAAGLISTASGACLDAFPQATVRAIVPRQTGELDACVRQGRGRLQVIPPKPDIDQEMLAADFVVTAGGSTVWELCALGRAFGVLVVADNQAAAVAKLVALGAALKIGTATTSREALTTRLSAAVHVPGGLPQMAERAASLVDGLGTTRVAGYIERLSNST